MKHSNSHRENGVWRSNEIVDAFGPEPCAHGNMMLMMMMMKMMTKSTSRRVLTLVTRDCRHVPKPKFQNPPIPRRGIL